MLKKRQKNASESAKLCSVKKREKGGFVSKNIRRMKFRNFSWFGLHTPDFGILRNFEMETKISIFLGHFFWFTRLPKHHEKTTKNEGL